MADASDVEDALADAIAVALGLDANGFSPAVGLSCRVTREWPNDEELTADLAARVLNVTVTSLPGVSRETTRYPEHWRPLSHPVTTVTATLVGQTLTLAAPAGPMTQQLVGIRLGTVPYVYETVASDAPASIAVALAALIPDATATGAALTLPLGPVTFRTAGFAPLFRETRRQRASLKAAFWAPDGTTRDIACKVVDGALAALHFIPLVDGTACRLRGEGSYVSDTDQKAGLWRRDLRYGVEYPTTDTMTAPAVLWGITSTNGNQNII